MERFSIAGRRKDCTLVKQDRIDSHSIYEKESIKVSSDTLNETCNYARKEPYTPESPIAEIDDAISINLTPEQRDLLKSNHYVKYYLDGDATTGASLDIQRHTEGQIIFTFQFKKVNIGIMLKAKHVGQMLQVSNSLLTSLVKSKKIISCKVGRLRRFFLRDVLDYLSKSGEVFGSFES